MIDGLIYKFFGWLDDMTKKVEDVLTFDFCSWKKKKKRKSFMYTRVTRKIMTIIAHEI